MTYLLLFSRKKTPSPLRKELLITASNLGEAIKIGRRVANDSNGVWQLDKATLQS